jgi:hypothetical protein
MKLTDENGVPTMAGANAMFAAQDEARANAQWREANVESPEHAPVTDVELDEVPRLASELKAARTRVAELEGSLHDAEIDAAEARQSLFNIKNACTEAGAPDQGHAAQRVRWLINNRACVLAAPLAPWTALSEDEREATLRHLAAIAEAKPFRLHRVGARALLAMLGHADVESGGGPTFAPRSASNDRVVVLTIGMGALRRVGRVRLRRWHRGGRRGCPREVLVMRSHALSRRRQLRRGRRRHQRRVAVVAAVLRPLLWRAS